MAAVGRQGVSVRANAAEGAWCIVTPESTLIA